MPWMPGCPRTDDDNGHGAGGGVQCGIMHMTYGSWAGDVATVVNSGLCTWVVGKEQGQWLQLMDSESISYNVGNWDCNQHSVAIEFTGVNEDVLTDWQVQAGAAIVAWVRDVHHVEVKYDDGADGSNDTSPWSGWYAHRAVMPDSGSQHSDFIDRSEWDRIVEHLGGTSAPTTDNKEDDMIIVIMPNPFGGSVAQLILGSGKKLKQWVASADACTYGIPNEVYAWNNNPGLKYDVKFLDAEASVNLLAIQKEQPVATSGLTEAQVQAAAEKAIKNVIHVG